VPHCEQLIQEVSKENTVQHLLTDLSTVDVSVDPKETKLHANTHPVLLGAILKRSSVRILRIQATTSAEVKSMVL